MKLVFTLFSFQVLFIFSTLISCGSRNETIGNISSPGSAGNQDIQTEPPSDSSNCQVVNTIFLGANILINGSFEEGHNLGENRWRVYTELGAWKANLEYNDAGFEIQNGQKVGDILPYHGNAKLELDAHETKNLSASDVDLYQELNTFADKDYLITFSYSPRIKGHRKSNRAEVYWGDQLIAGLNGEVVAWQRYRLKVQGVGDATKLSFQALIDKDRDGAYLDDIRVQEILPDETNAVEILEEKTCSL